MTAPQPTLAVTELTTLTERVGELAEAIARQASVLERIEAQLADLATRSEWYDVQEAQMLRVIATALRQIRETQVYGLLSEGPVTASALRELLQSAAIDPLPTILHTGGQ